VSGHIARRAGSAIAWRMAQLAGVKIIFLARTLVLARLLVPDDFGLLAVSLIAVDILKRITNLGMIPALIQRADADESHYSAAWTAGVVRALAIAAVVAAFAPGLASLFGDSRATNIIRVVALQPLIEALGSIKVAEITRDLRFRQLALIALPDALVNTLLSVLLASTLGVWALVAGALAGKLAYLVMSYVLAPYRPRLSFSVAAARPLMQFGRWIFAIGLVTLAGSSVMQMIIARQLGAAELGLYFLAARLAFIPAEVSGEVIGAVAFPLYSRMQADRQEIVRIFRGIYLGMLTLLMPVCLLMVALAPSLVENVLGARWHGSVPLIQLLALVSLIGLLGDSIEPILQGIGRPGRQFFIELAHAAVLVAVIWPLVGRYGAVSAGIASLAAIVVVQILSAAFAVRFLPRPFAGLGVPVLIILAVSALGAGLAWSLAELIPGVIGLFVAGLLSAAVIGLLLWNIDRRFAFGLARQLVHTFPQLSILLRQAPADS
jgi:O-antigen/teichoic acid export membrane protein